MLSKIVNMLLDPDTKSLMATFMQHLHHAWTSHGGPWRTTNSSIQGMFEAFSEFQNRSLYDSKVVIVFLSNMWDVHG